MYFTFLVLTYNQERYIIQNLESIRFQIEKYGEAKYFQIIIADDHSTDKTVNMAKIWLDVHKNLFKEITFLESAKNEGTVHNIIRCIDQIRGKYFKLIACDDIFAFTNLFNEVNRLDFVDILQNCYIHFDDNKIITDRKRYEYYYYYKHYSLKDLKFLLKTGSYLSHAALLYRKELITSDVIEFINQFFLCEDHPLFYRIFIDNPRLRFYFSPLPIILYRDSVFSVRKRENTLNHLLLNDNIDLFSYFRSNTRNFFFKIYYNYQIKELYRFHESKTRIQKIERLLLDPIYLLIKTKYLFTKTKFNSNFNQFYENLEKQFYINTNHLIRITENAKAFETRYIG